MPTKKKSVRPVCSEAGKKMNKSIKGKTKQIRREGAGKLGSRTCKK
jgi:hypothetical protein